MLADQTTWELGSEGGDLGNGRSDVRGPALRHLVLEIAPVLLAVAQPDVLGGESLELEDPETVMKFGRRHAANRPPLAARCRRPDGRTWDYRRRRRWRRAVPPPR